MDLKKAVTVRTNDSLMIGKFPRQLLDRIREYKYHEAVPKDKRKRILVLEEPIVIEHIGIRIFLWEGYQIIFNNILGIS